MTCSFCRLLKSCKSSDESARRKDEYKTRYLSALIKKTTYITDAGEEIPSGQVTFGNIPLNYCPECGIKIDPEQVDAPPMSCHEDAYLNSLCGKLVKITFSDDTIREGILRRDTEAQLKFAGLDDKRCVGYSVYSATRPLGRLLHFRKSHIKKIEEAAAQ